MRRLVRREQDWKLVQMSARLKLRFPSLIRYLQPHLLESKPNPRGQVRAIKMRSMEVVADPEDRLADRNGT